MRAFQKMNARAGIPVAYTEGFSPHQKLSFAHPLSVGLESDGEYADMELKEEAAPEKLLESFNRVSPEGLAVTKVSVLPKDSKNAMASVRSASYRVSFREGYSPKGFSTVNALNSFKNAGSLKIMKETKKGLKEVELREGIRELRAEGDFLIMRVDTGSENNIRPSLVMDALCDLLSVPRPGPHSLLITRLDLYGEDDRPLIDD